MMRFDPRRGSGGETFQVDKGGPTELKLNPSLTSEDHTHRRTYTFQSGSTGRINKTSRRAVTDSLA